MGVLHAVVQLDHAIFEALGGEQVQGHVAVTPRYQGNALPNEHWDDADDKLVDGPLVKKGGDGLAAAHQPDIFARLLAQTTHLWADRIVREFDARRGAHWRRMTGEHDMSMT